MAIIQKRKSFKVTIPAGIDNGQMVRMADGGEPGKNGGPRGSLLVEAVVSPHPIFKRQDMDIYSTVSISFAKACSWRANPCENGRWRGRI